MILPKRGREYWQPELDPMPVGFVAVKAEFGASGWVNFQTVDGKQVVLVAGPDVDVITYPHPVGTVVLVPPRVIPRVLLVGPGSAELVIRDAGAIDVI